MNNKKGFTLTELVVVIAVIGVIAAILILLMPSVIERSNKASALTDAKNIAEMYEMQKNNKGSGIVILIEKGKDCFAFGYYNGSVVQDVSNPYKDMSADDLFTLLQNENCVEIYGNSPENITEKLNTGYKNAAVYENCGITNLVSSISIVNATEQNAGDTVYIGVDEKYRLSVDIENADPSLLKWKCSNSNAEVDGGFITGKTPGDVTITVTYGNKSDSINAVIIGYTDFNGTLAELKAAIEEHDIPLVMLRMNTHLDLVDDDVSLPINIESGLRTRILCEYATLSVYVNDGMDDLFNVDGGNLWLNSDTNIYDDGFSVIDRRTGTGNIETAMSLVTVKNGGTATIVNIPFALRYNMSESSHISISKPLLNNENGTLILDYTALWLDAVQYTDAEYSSCVVYNGEKSTLIMKNGCSINNIADVAVCIENHGKATLMSPENYIHISADERGILNYGQIDTLSGVEFGIDEGGIAIESTGNNAYIGEVANCEVNGSSEIGNDFSTLEEQPLYVFKLSGGSYVKHISGGIFCYQNALFSADSESESKLSGIISGGRYSTYIYDRYIMSGFVCKSYKSPDGIVYYGIE